MDRETAMGGCIGAVLSLLFSLLFWGATLYVALHFIVKWW